jgi:hypothetical protein
MLLVLPVIVTILALAFVKYVKSDKRLFGAEAGEKTRNARKVTCVSAELVIRVA